MKLFSEYHLTEEEALSLIFFCGIDQGPVLQVPLETHVYLFPAFIIKIQTGLLVEIEIECDYARYLINFLLVQLIEKNLVTDIQVTRWNFKQLGTVKS